MPNIKIGVINLSEVLGRKWTEEDIEFIKNNYQKMSDSELAEKLNRTVVSINTKRKRIGCTRRNIKYNWNTVLDCFNKTDYILMSNEEDYKDSSTKSIKYICPNHKDKGIQKIALGHMINGEGCRYCGIESRAKKKTFNFDEREDEFRERCKELDFTYLGYKRIDGYVTIRFICNKHKEFGEQTQLLGSFIKTNGCKCCNRKNIPIWYIKKELEEKAPNIEVLDSFTKLTDRVRCRCKIHNTVVERQINYILKGKACCKCRKGTFYKSIFEGEIGEILEKWNYSFEKEYYFDECKDKYRLPFDFYLPDFNICIEFDGRQHYLPVYGEEQLKITQLHDEIKNKFCENNNITLIRIPYYFDDYYNTLEECLFDEFVKHNLIKLAS